MRTTIANIYVGFFTILVTGISKFQYQKWKLLS